MSYPRISAFIRGGAVLFFLVPLAHAACSGEWSRQAKTQPALLHMEDLWVQALSDRSAAELDCLLSPDFMDSTWKGDSLNHDQVLQAAAKRAPVPAGAKHEFADMKARIYGDTGIVTGVSYWSYADGSEHARARFTDVFFYREHRWQAVAGHETSVETAK